VLSGLGGFWLRVTSGVTSCAAFSIRSFLERLSFCLPIHKIESKKGKCSMAIMRVLDGEKLLVILKRKRFPPLGMCFGGRPTGLMSCKSASGIYHPATLKSTRILLRCG